MKQLAEMNRYYEMSEASRGFASLARLMMVAKGDPLVAGQLADAASETPPRVREVLKAAVAGGSLGDAAWAGNLSAYRFIANGFIQSLANNGVFDRMLTGGMKRLPLKTRTVVVTDAVTASVTGEALARPVSRLSLEGANILAVRAACAIVVMTNELLRVGTNAADFVGNELRAGVIAATDLEFLTGLAQGLTPIDSFGGAAPIQDLQQLAEEIRVTANSRLYVIVTPALAKDYCFWPDETSFFGNMTLGGGTIRGMQVMVSDQLDAGTIMMIDANAIGADSDTITLDTSRQGSIQMSDAPTQSGLTGTGSTMVSLFQTNSAALKAFRYFGFDRLTDNAVAIMTGAQYAGTESGGL